MEGQERLLLVYIGHPKNRPDVVKVKLESLDGYKNEYIYTGPLELLAKDIRGKRRNRNLITIMPYNEVGVFPLSQERLSRIEAVIRK